MEFFTKKRRMENRYREIIMYTRASIWREKERARDASVRARQLTER